MSSIIRAVDCPIPIVRITRNFRTAQNTRITQNTQNIQITRKILPITCITLFSERH